MEQQESASAALVRDPRSADVLAGLELPHSHPGNVTFMQLARMCSAEYRVANYSQQPVIIANIVASVKQGGRFLRRDPRSGMWQEMDDGLACAMTEEALRVCREMDGAGGAGGAGVSASNQQRVAGLAQNHAHHVHQNSITAAAAASRQEGPQQQQMMSNQQIVSFDQRGMNSQLHLSGSVVTCQPTMPHPSNGTDDRTKQHSSGMLAGLSSIETSVAPPPKTEDQLMGAIRGELARQRQDSLLRHASLAADDALYGRSAQLSKSHPLGDETDNEMAKMVLTSAGMHAKRSGKCERPVEVPQRNDGAKHSIPGDYANASEPTLKSSEERAVSHHDNRARNGYGHLDEHSKVSAKEKIAYDELDELGSKSFGPKEQDLKEDDSPKPASEGVVADELTKPESDTVGSNQKDGEEKAPSGIDETSVEEDRYKKEDEANLKILSQVEVEAESANIETGTGGSEQKPSHAVSVTLPMPLAAASDVNILPPVQAYIRKHCIVLFEATASDEGGEKRKGRQAAVKEGCVGVRCAFCGHLGRSKRAGQATSFPSSVANLRTAVAMLRSRHFPSCTEMPSSVREDLARLKTEKSDNTTNCNDHWIDSAKELGLVDTKGGIRFVSRGAKPAAESNVTPVESGADSAGQPEDTAEPAGGVTFYCPKCQQHIRFASARTASASFGCHVRACGKKKRPKKTSVNTAPAKKRRSARVKSEFNPNEEATITSSVGPGPAKKARKRATRMETLPVVNDHHFSREEDLRLYEGFKEFGPQWKKISELYFDGARKNEDLRVRRRTNEYKERTGDEGLPQPGRRSKGPPGIPGQSRKRRQDARVKEAKETSNGTSVAEEDDASSSKKGKAELYPHAPMGHLWLNEALGASSAQKNAARADGGSLVGRCWAWDEGFYVDGQFDPTTQARERKLESSLLKGGCACEATRLSAPTDSIDPKAKSDDGKSQSGRARRTQRSASSAIDIADELARGTLDPHTLIACDEYEMGPESRFAKEGQPGKAQPFIVRVNPDASFLADLHAHLCSSEIIGLLGGRYVKEEKCIYIQAAFPCKATDRLDSGSTDVEMDPIGQIYATEAIATQGLSVVGWYHSHPDFRPTPSVVDVENQASYQQLFQGDGDAGSVPPFVGLIVGTYDGKNPSSHSVMRWFHVQPKPASDTQVVNYPMNVRTTNRHYRKMTFDDESTEESVRRSMTQHGTQIRRALESRKSSCAVPGIGSFKQTETGAKSDSGQGSSSKPRHVAETGESPLLLSDALLEQRKGIWQFESACPLFFTEAERSVLEIDDETIPYDVFAGIIWFAVEREQQMLPKVVLEEASASSPSVSASSRSILELLLRTSLTSTVLRQRLYNLIHCLEDDQTESATPSEEPLVEHTDAAVFHNVDALLSHYAPKLNKINPFATWSGSGDKGKELNGATSEPWAEYYLTNILRMKPVETDEGRVWKGWSKMKRGHKIASSLLKWARNMQLSSVTNERNGRDTFAISSSNGLVFDHEQTLCDEARAGGSLAGQSNQYVYFVAEIMRLLAARWRESGARANGRSTPQRRGQPPKRLSSSRPSLDQGTKR